jgi:hypothetical protein
MWLLGLIISLLLSGCSLLSMEEPALVSTESDAQSYDQGQKNLAAVRAMLAEERQRSSLTAGSSDKRSPEPATLSWPPDWLSLYFWPKRLSREELDLVTLQAPTPSSSRSMRRAVPPEPIVKAPRRPDLPARGYEAEPSPPVPAYTVPAPIGSTYPGSARCVPDLLGGQRCQAN